jgi:hypothetical protein
MAVHPCSTTGTPDTERDKNRRERRERRITHKKQTQSAGKASNNIDTRDRER